ncbi:urea transporter [Solibacillus daqui]|uniref:urea transporter n=1 Tax=Solibacillus daqui TaxID=2912187 RepID=UPI002365D445|nr:urea transporter [Solibacillus daqui]
MNVSKQVTSMEDATVNNKMNWQQIFVASFKGISQVGFIENTITGILFLLAITIVSPLLAVVAWLSSLIAVLIGIAGKADEKLIRQGLLSFSPVLTGMALTLFLTGPYYWIIALLGAAVTTLFAAAMMHFMRNTDIPILTFPFIVVSWSTLLASYQFETIQLSSSLSPQNLSHFILTTEDSISWFQATLNGFGQVFFLKNFISATLVFIGLFFAGWQFGIFALIGNLFAMLTAFVLGGSRDLIQAGLYGFNAILTILAVAIVFKGANSRLSFIIGIIGACLSVPLTATITTLLVPYGLPTFTMPFVLCTWMLLGARKIFLRF